MMSCGRTFPRRRWPRHKMTSPATSACRSATQSHGIRGRRLAQSCFSMTSSARATSVGGTAIPSAFAVLRFRAISYFVGCCTGRFRWLGTIEYFRNVTGEDARTLGNARGVRHEHPRLSLPDRVLANLALKYRLPSLSTQKSAVQIGSPPAVGRLLRCAYSHGNRGQRRWIARSPPGRQNSCPLLPRFVGIQPSALSLTVQCHSNGLVRGRMLEMSRCRTFMRSG